MLHASFTQILLVCEKGMWQKKILPRCVLSGTVFTVRVCTCNVKVIKKSFRLRFCDACLCLSPQNPGDPPNLLRVSGPQKKKKK